MTAKLLLKVALHAITPPSPPLPVMTAVDMTYY